jgi:probable F420-dependent oxidoreductase
MALAFGTQLPVQAQSVLMATEEWEAEAGPDELARAARAFDAAGFDYVGVCDHVAVPRAEAGRMSTTWYDLLTTLGWLAGVTSRVRLLSHVLVAPYRHPAQVAKAFCTLDALSGGRAVLGVGTGHLEPEFGLLGADYAARAERTVETVRTVRAAFADEWGLGEFGQRPRPAQAGGPPIWIGGSSHAALRRAAQLGDGWLPQGPPKDGLRAAVAELHRLREEAGREGPFAVNAGIVCYVGEPAWDTGAWCRAGAPEVIAEAVRALAARGVTHVQVRLRSRSCDELVEQVEAFARDVVPLVEEGT